MNIIQLIRLILKNIKIIFIVPVILVGVVISLTANLPKSYSSKTIIYTGFGTGLNLKSVSNANFDYLKTQAAFDNLINIIEARKTYEEVAIRLLAKHMAIEKIDGNLISIEHYKDVKKNVFDSLKIKPSNNESLIFDQLWADYQNGGNNFIYKLLHGKHPYYSIDAVSGISVKRISNSDLIEINFDADDAGVCYQTLKILNEVFIKNYQKIKEGETHSVVGYFEDQLSIVKGKLDQAEQTLLNFNKDNKIINYYEQTKHISKLREDIELLFQQELMQSAAAKASIIKIEDQLNRRNKTLLKSSNMIDLRNELSEITTKIALLEVKTDNKENYSAELSALYAKSENIKDELNQIIKEIGIVENTTAGLSQQDLMTKWLEQIILHEESNARISIYKEKINDLKRVYSEYAPLGATMMRIERQISVTEREYLSILQGLNESKIMQRNIEMSTNLDIIDPPFYPVVPKASKRSVMIVGAGFAGIILTIFLLIIMEYFDSSIKSHKRLSKLTNLEYAGAFPNLYKTNKKVDLDFILKRTTDEIAQKIRQKAFNYNSAQIHKPFITVIFSTAKGDGKSTIARRLHNAHMRNGFNVAFFNYKIDGRISDNDIELGCHYYNFEDLMSNDFKVDCFFEKLLETDYEKFDFIFLEIPSILHYPTPVRMLRNVHFALMIARANRPWSEAETNVLNSFKKTVIEKTETEVLTNGVEIDILESIIGEIPKKRGFFRRLVKQLIKFQFNSSKKIN
ncbi:MAG: hypothetical protein JXR60_09030 [Bacteroidales bacterium]|nr:hypothetical protein [Bacteroidales bacterium]